MEGSDQIPLISTKWPTASFHVARAENEMEETGCKVEREVSHLIQRGREREREIVTHGKPSESLLSVGQPDYLACVGMTNTLPACPSACLSFCESLSRWKSNLMKSVCLRLCGYVSGSVVARCGGPAFLPLIETSSDFQGPGLRKTYYNLDHTSRFFLSLILPLPVFLGHPLSLSLSFCLYTLSPPSG